ncbi:MAG: metal ABC transporter permease [Actinomycetota bacterium]
MDWLIDPFSEPQLQRALISGVLAALAFSVIGTWVVIRGMTFLGDALAHGIIPGVALALLFGFSPVVGAAIAAVVMIAGINFVHRQTAFSEDTGIGLLFVGMLTFGVILATAEGVEPEELLALLFGDVLSISVGAIVLMAVIAGLAIAATILLYRHFLVMSFNKEKAGLFGLHPNATHAVMLGLLTIAIVGSFQTVGTLLVFGLLIGPPSTAALLVRRVPTMMVTAAGIGAASVVTGLVISYHLGTSGSATMAIVPIVTFFVVLTVKTLGQKQRAALGA